MGIQVRSSADIELALRKLPGFGLVVVPDAFANVNRARIVKSAAENRIPATYPYQQFVLDGGLMTYGPDPADIVRRSAAYVDRILKGSKPAELPVQGATKFEFASTQDGQGARAGGAVHFAVHGRRSDRIMVPSMSAIGT
jgi:ABC-type uncharacterized transport system substrate-binding protein